MKTYNIEITKESLDELLDSDNLDKSNKLKGGKWFNLIEDQIVKVEGENLRNQLAVNRGRYYPDSKRATAYILVYLKCRKCIDLNYIVKLAKKPEPYQPIIFTIEKSDEHDKDIHNIPTPRAVRGLERIKLAKELLTDHGGSAKAYYETEVGKVDSVVPPSQDVVRHCLTQYINKDNLPHNPQGLNMIGNLLHAAITAKASMPRKSLSGYIHEIMIHEKFGMTLCMEEQLEALHCVPVNDRILHFDATGGLVKAKGDGVEYGQILTYAIIAQSIKKLGLGINLLLSETTTSSHDTESITKMLLTVQAAYGRRYPNDAKLCYMIVLDLAWASIHAACTINRESFVDYNKRIWRLANGDQSAIMKDKFLLLTKKEMQ